MKHITKELTIFLMNTKAVVAQNAQPVIHKISNEYQLHQRQLTQLCLVYLELRDINSFIVTHVDMSGKHKSNPRY
jgi:hypothetical protein